MAMFILLLALSACQTNMVFDDNEEIKNYVWDSKVKPAFTFEIKDTTVLYNIYINVRHVDYYPFNNVWINLSASFPDGNRQVNRVDVPLADDSGKWHGEGLGDIWDYRHLIQQGAFFNKTGKYTFALEHLMRQDPLPGIMSIGIRVENTGIKRK
jgi:gliding motility-associated lipoprotein GldH